MPEDPLNHVMVARSGDLDDAVGLGHEALTGPRRSLPSLLLVSKELAAVLIDAVGTAHPRVRDYLDELQMAAANHRGPPPIP